MLSFNLELLKFWTGTGLIISFLKILLNKKDCVSCNIGMLYH